MPASTEYVLCALVVLPAFTCASAIHAQPLVARTSSLESVIANADQVFVARLVKLGETKQIEGRSVHNAVIEIQETIKRDLFETESVPAMQINLSIDRFTLADWQKQSSRLLVAIDLEHPDADLAIEIMPGATEVFRADFSLLDQPEQVIRAAKEYARSLPARVKRLHTFRLTVPPELVEGTRWEDFYSLQLDVPADDDLEARALRYIESEDYGKRYDGVRAIRYFRSEANARRVERLLRDDGWSIYQSAESNGGIEVRYHGVRAEAYRTLKSWGISVDKPIVRDEVAKPTK
ncbi:MAG: hypothetical protein AAFU85_09620 [Planctomycetota bacterium]